jgi:hypothetical protein
VIGASRGHGGHWQSTGRSEGLGVAGMVDETQPERISSREGSWFLLFVGLFRSSFPPPVSSGAGSRGNPSLRSRREKMGPRFHGDDVVVQSVK